MKFITSLLLFAIISYAILAQTAPKSGKYQFDTYPVELLKQDLNDLYNKLDSTHYNLFHKYPKHYFDSVKTDIEAAINRPMNQCEFYFTLLPLFNLLEDGHTMLGFSFKHLKAFSTQGGKFLPLKVFINNQNVYVVENYSEIKIPLYSKVTAVNDVKVEDIIEKLKIMTNNELADSENDYMSFFFPRILYPLYGFDSIFNIRYETVNNSIEAATLNGIRYEDFTFEDAPAYLFYKLNNKTAVLDINLCEGKSGFPSFCDSVFSLIQNDETENLIIDLRDNPGGTTFLGDTLLTYLTNKKFSQYPKRSCKYSPYSREKSDSIFSMTYNENLERSFDNPKLFKGNIFALTNINTYSAASIMAATLQCYKIAKIIGQETGGTQIFFGENVQLELPNSKLKFLVSFQIEYSPCGKSWNNGIIPDYEIPVNIEDMRNGKDTEIEFVKELINKRPGF